MALDKFRASPLPNPPAAYDPQYIRQLIRVLEVYFNQLDSNTPNHAQQYTADHFVGGDFTGTNVTTTVGVYTDQLGFKSGYGGYLSTWGTLTDALISYGHRNGRQISDDIMAGNIYGNYFYGNGIYLSTPYAQLWSDQNQTAASTASAYTVTLNHNDFPDGIVVTSGSRIKFSTPGIYNLTYSIQFSSNSNTTENVNLWLRYNGVDVANSNSQFSLPARKSAGVLSALIAVTPIMVDVLAANDYVELAWQTSSTSVQIAYIGAVAANPGVTPAIPATPSAFVNIAFVSSQFPPVTRIAPLPVFGFGQVGDVTVYTP